MLSSNHRIYDNFVLFYNNYLKSYIYRDFLLIDHVNFLICIFMFYLFICISGRGCHTVVRRQVTVARDGHQWSWVVEEEVLGLGWAFEEKKVKIVFFSP